MEIAHDYTQMLEIFKDGFEFPQTLGFVALNAISQWLFLQNPIVYMSIGIVGGFLLMGYGYMVIRCLNLLFYEF